MEKLQKIVNRCKGGVFLTVNGQRDYYQTADEKIKENADLYEDVEPGVLEEMKKRDVIINLHFYPDTPTGFYSLYHFELSQIIDKAYEILF